MAIEKSSDTEMVTESNSFAFEDVHDEANSQRRSSQIKNKLID